MATVPERMAGVLLTGHGGVDRLEYRTDLPVPRPRRGEVLVQVTATAKNNTDRKVREGLYPTDRNDRVTSFQLGDAPTLTFPRIQGADVAGRVVATGPGCDPARVGERGLLDFNIYADDKADLNLVPDYFGHGRDGGFAEYIAVPSEQFHAIASPGPADAELAALGMCSYQTAFRMLNAAGVGPGEHILVTGASGGVGTALIQLCRMLGAVPHAVSSSGKDVALKALGAHSVIDRTRVTDWRSAVTEATGGAVIDAVMDLAGGALTNPLIDVMTQRMSARRTYPRLSIAGASAGNVTEILWTKIYLNQVQIFGVSHGTRAEAEKLMGWIRDGALKPVLHRAFRLSDIQAAERYFVERDADFVGKIVIVPDAQWQEHGARFAAPEPTR